MSTTVGPSSLADVLGEDWRRPGGSAHALAEAMRALVVDGRLAVRTRVPSERALAPELGVSRGTVSRAYDRLREDGFLVSARGAGSWLTLPDAGGAGPAPRLAPAWGVDLSVAALPAPEPQLGEAAISAARALARRAPSHGYAASGLPELRAAIARRFRERGVDTTPEQVLVTAGAQHALHLVLRCSAPPATACSSTRPPTRARWPRCAAPRPPRRGAARPRRLGRRRVGADADGGRAAPRDHDARPPQPDRAHHGRRAAREIVAACARAGVLVVADETSAELRIDGPPRQPPLAAYDAGGAVVTLGSMSKSAWGGLRSAGSARTRG